VFLFPFSQPGLKPTQCSPEFLNISQVVLPDFVFSSGGPVSHTRSPANPLDVLTSDPRNPPPPTLTPFTFFCSFPDLGSFGMIEPRVPMVLSHSHAPREVASERTLLKGVFLHQGHFFLKSLDSWTCRIFIFCVMPFLSRIRAFFP